MGRGRAAQSLGDPVKDSSLDSKSNGRPHEGFKQERCITRCGFGNLSEARRTDSVGPEQNREGVAAIRQEIITVYARLVMVTGPYPCPTPGSSAIRSVVYESGCP